MNPRWHGNGFVQLYLNPLTRLHIWSPDMKATRVINAKIHDHKFEFISRILVGEIINRIWKVIDNPEGKFCKSMVYAGTTDRSRNPLPTGERVDLEHICDKHYTKDDIYKFGGPGVYHETLYNNYTVTIMTKTHIVEDYLPRIISPWDQVPDHAFAPEKSPSKDRLIEEVHNALKYF